MAKKKIKTTGYEPHTAFDLEIKTKAQGEELAEHLKNLKVSSGWMIMKQILEGNLSLLERQIVTKKNLNGEILTDADVDDLRKTHFVMEELVNKPDFLIAQLTKEDGAGIPTYDPYASDARQLRGDPERIGSPMARTLITE
jgi:hypothetical protein